jgi:penicillin-binding protein 1A
VGSSFKIYDYTAAFEAGMKPYDTVLDTPTTFYTPGGPYTPHDYERASWSGTMTLIDAFAQSRNIPALRLADKVGIHKVIDVAHRFGVTSDIPAYLPVAIGAADLTLAEQVGSYSVFPNDGIRITPHYIRRVVSPDGNPMQERAPEVREVIPVDIAREMMTLLQAVVQHGTAAAASQMNHALGGKTGTTNDYTDAWFIGFSPSVTCGTWVGFDDRRSLGEKETGARVALPIWMDFMKVAIADNPNEQFPRANAPKKKLDVAVTADQQTAAAPPDTSDENVDTTLPPPPPQSAVPPPVPSNGAAPDDEAAPAAGPQLPAPKKPLVVPSQKPAVTPPQKPAVGTPQKPAIGTPKPNDEQQN